MKKLIHKLLCRETITYLIFGVLTTLVNWIIFDRLNARYGTDRAGVHNAIAFVLSVLFAFLTNKPFVFRSNDWSFKTLTREVPLFFGGRIVSFLLEEGMILLARDVFHADRYQLFRINGLSIVKIFPIAVIVVVLNYLFSKLFAFRKRDEKKPSDPNEPDLNQESKNGGPQQ